MTSAQAWAIHLSNLTVGGTGLVYGWMRYFAESDDPFSVVNHPWQPHAQHAHVLLAPLLVFAVGWIWQVHVWMRIRSGHASHRRSGIAFALLFFPMVLSGYALQVAVDELWLDIWIVVHVAASLAWLAFGVVHPLLPRARAA